MKRIFLTLLLGVCQIAGFCQQTLTVSVNNPLDVPRQAVPVVIRLSQFGLDVKSAQVTAASGTEIASQLDDLDGDGAFDELCFMTDLCKREKTTFTVTLDSQGASRTYEPKVYAEMLISNKKIKSSNKQNLYISSLTVDNGTNPYWMLHHHGPAFENELVAYRIYFDHRQTVDIYGKVNKGLELRQTQFYPDREQKANGLGDDVLWVGETLGLGTVRGWDGKAPTMLKDVEHRTLSIVSRGPLRTIVEVVDKGWNAPLPPSSKRIDMTTRYTLYAGRRDCAVSLHFDRPVNEFRFATGIINVKNSVEHSDHKGLRGCWGTDWPVSEKDSAGHKRETVGLGICIPAKNVVRELPPTKDNYPFVIGNIKQDMDYFITFGSDNESFGYHDSTSWFAYLDAWKRECDAQPEVRIVKQ